MQTESNGLALSYYLDDLRCGLLEVCSGDDCSSDGKVPPFQFCGFGWVSSIVLITTTLRALYCYWSAPIKPETKMFVEKICRSVGAADEITSVYK